MVSYGTAHAASTASDLNRDADQALQTLYRTNPVAASIAKQSRAVLVFPNIVKAGLICGVHMAKANSNRVDGLRITTIHFPRRGVSKLAPNPMATPYS